MKNKQDKPWIDENTSGYRTDFSLYNNRIVKERFVKL